MFIGGEEVESESGAWFDVTNPATGELVDKVPKGTREDAKKAVDAADQAFRAWSKTPALERSRALLRIAEAVRGSLKDLAVTLTKEQGKPLSESMAELNSFCNTCEYYAGLATKPRGSNLILSSGAVHINVLKVPVGVVGAILPWNFPVSLLGWKMAPALAAGNTMVVKPASTTPLTEIQLAKLVSEAGVPKGTVNIVTGPGGVVGDELLQNPQVQKIAFTGETGTGRRIMRQAAEQIKRVTLELGGSDPMIVCDDADLDLAVEGAVWGRFRNCGQSCTSVKRLILFEKIADEFVSKMARMVKEIKVGNGLNPEVNMGPLNNAPQRASVEEMVKDAIDHGAKLIAGGARPTGAEFGKGHFYSPTLLLDVDASSRMLREECFGPALPIITAANLDEAVDRANQTIYGLGSSIWTKDLIKATQAAERIEAGTVWINSPPIARPEAPFGGFKQSGIGRELGLEGFEHYVETKSVQIDVAGKNKAWRWPPS
jgi:succinate-semialdehyde dehydrogenase/glutarate-semialdehyde dehydrogenase